MTAPSIPTSASAEQARSTSSGLPLAGIRVADFSWVLAGPHCTKWLAALGAEVIKVESHYKPDRFRAVAPFINDHQSLDGSVAWNMLNYSKRDCTINLGTADGRRLARQLVDSSDVVIENFSTGVIERLGLDYATLSKEHQSLVMVSSSGLGRTGPDTGMRAFGKSIHGFTGHTYLTGWPDMPPRGIGGTWTDPVTGVTAALAILAGLAQVRRSGRGAHFDLSMAEATIAIMAEPFLSYLATGIEPQPSGNRSPETAPHNTYRCADGGWVAVAAHGPAEWSALCTAVAMPEPLSRLATAEERGTHLAEIDRVLDVWCAARSRDDAAHMLRAAGVCSVPVQDINEVLDDPHYVERQIIGELTAAGIGPYHIVKAPWVQTPPLPARYTPSPKIGQDNDYVFRTVLGLTDAEIATYTAADVLV